MLASILQLEIKPNWRLMIGIAIPIGICMFFRPYERGAWVASDWEYLRDWSQRYVKGNEFWYKLGEAFFVNFGIGLMIGWLTQYLVMLIRAVQAAVFSRKKRNRFPLICDSERAKKQH